MNINKIVKMARSKEPNRLLAKLSMQWAGQSNKDNPVKEAVSLWQLCWFIGTDISLFLTWLVITIVWRPHMSTMSGKGPTLWTLIGVVLIVLLFSLLSMWESDTLAEFHDVQRFIRAVSILEDVMGKSLDKWWTNDDYFTRLEGEAYMHLVELASAVQMAERIDKEAIEQAPWRVPSFEKQAKPKRYHFESHLDLLTTILPQLPEHRGEYYGYKVTKSEDSATK